MNGKPVVLFIETAYENGNSPNHSREAFACLLRNDFKCEVRVLDNEYYLNEEKEYLKKLAMGGWMSFLIYTEHDYGRPGDVENVVELVRKEISATMPIVVLKSYINENPFEVKTELPNVYCWGRNDRKLMTFIREQLSRWVKPADIFGTTTPDETHLLHHFIQNAYEKNNLTEENEENMLGVPDRNSQVVFQSLRLKVLPSQFLREEFDRTIPKRRQKIASVARSVYNEELERIRQMDDVSRKKFYDDMGRVQGMIPAEGGGVICTRRSRGENAWGFAISPETLLYVITDGFGEHQLAKVYLGDQLERLAELKSLTLDEEGLAGIQYSLIDGLILQNVEGFKTPLACIYLGMRSHDSDEDMGNFKRVAEFLIKDGRFIPVSVTGHLLGMQPRREPRPRLPELTVEEMTEQISKLLDEKYGEKVA